MAAVAVGAATGGGSWVAALPAGEGTQAGQGRARGATGLPPDTDEIRVAAFVATARRESWATGAPTADLAVRATGACAAHLAIAATDILAHDATCAIDAGFARGTDRAVAATAARLRRGAWLAAGVLAAAVADAIGADTEVVLAGAASAGRATLAGALALPGCIAGGAEGADLALRAVRAAEFRIIREAEATLPRPILAAAFRAVLGVALADAAGAVAIKADALEAGLAPSAAVAVGVAGQAGVAVAAAGAAGAARAIATDAVRAAGAAIAAAGGAAGPAAAATAGATLADATLAAAVGAGGGATGGRALALPAPGVAGLPRFAGAAGASAATAVA